LLKPISDGIGRDLIPAEAKVFGEDIERCLAAGDRAKAEQLVRALHERGIQQMSDVMAAAPSNEKVRRRRAMEVGTAWALEDLTTLLRILVARDVLAEWAHRLPERLCAFEREQVEHVKRRLTRQPRGGRGMALRSRNPNFRDNA
jgi:hypothetical protein